MRLPLPYAIAAAIGALLVGYFLGKSTSFSNRADASAAASAPATAGKSAPAPQNTTPADAQTAALGKDFEHSVTEITEDPNYLRQAHRLYQLVENLSAGQIPAALNAALHLDPQKRMMLTAGLLGRWAELEPRAAAEYAFGMPKDQMNSWSKMTVLSTWAAKDFEGASQYVLSRSEGSERQEAIGALAGGLAQRDPVRALDFLDQHATGDLGRQYYSMIFSQWAMKDFDAASKRALALTDRQARRNALQSMMFNQMGKAPQEMLNWAKDLPDREIREDMTRNAILNWSRMDPHAALAYAKTMPAGNMRDSAFSLVIGELATRDINEARLTVEQLSEPARTTAMQSLVTSWMNRDQKAALQFAKELPEGATRARVISSLSGQLADKDTTAALELTELLPPGNERDSARQQIAWTWGRSDPKAAAEYFLKNPSSGDYNNALSNVVSNWASNEPSEALAWVQKLPESKDKAQSLSNILGQLASNDPQAAAAEMAKLTGESRTNAAYNVAGTWARNDPAAAAEWASSLPDEGARENALNSVASTWSNIDPVKAAKWLESLPVGRGRDRAVGTFAERVMARDPEGAAAWAATIADENSRTSRLQAIARSWLKSDDAAARAWLAQTQSLPAETKENLLKLK